jgi:hypothetical protein
MKRLSNIMGWRYRHAGSIDSYLAEREGSGAASARSAMSAVQWSQFWFLMRDALKKEGVHRPLYASTAAGRVI